MLFYEALPFLASIQSSMTRDEYVDLIWLVRYPSPPKRSSWNWPIKRNT